MAQSDKIQLFEDKRIRTAWDAEKEEWYFSIVDVVAVLTDSPNPQTYWRVLKKRLKDEGNETVTSCNALKMTAADGKHRLTDVADTEQLLRIIQSIPSPKAEPFKLWLAQVGRERIEETIDPELTIDRALETYLKKGYTREWINQRLQAIQVRKELTDEWDARGVQKGVEYAILTDEISRAWSGMSTRQYKNLKGLKKENLRDNMTTLELVLNIEQRHRQCQRHHHQHRLFFVSSQIGKGHLMELRSPGAALFFLGLHRICIFGSLHRRNSGCHFPGLGAGQKHRQQGKQHGANKDHRRSADGGDACIQLGGAQDNRYQNSANAVAQQQSCRNADQTKQKCLLANDAFELPGRCANGFQKPVKPDIPCNRDLENVIDDKIPGENHQQQKSCYGDHKFRIELRLQLG